MELLAKPVRRKKRPNFKPEFKKQLAQRSMEPGVSVSLLAQENDINVNMLFKWRRQLREGRFDGVVRRPAMLPVTIVDDTSDVPALPVTVPTETTRTTKAQESMSGQSGMIEIQTGDAVIRFDGAADLSAIRAVLAMLRP